MELRQLAMFCALAETKSFTAAAQKIHTVQSNVTMRIKELESEYGQPLFVRQRSNISLTPAGRILLEYATQILKLSADSHKALQNRDRPSGDLRLGAMETTAAIRLPKVLSAYRKKYPQVRLSLRTGTTQELIKAVESSAIDAAFVGGRHSNATLNQTEVFREELVLVSCADVDTVQTLKARIPEQAILVFRSGCFYRSTFENWLQEEGFATTQIIEMGSLDGIIASVSLGMGVTLLPRATAEQYMRVYPIRCHAIRKAVSEVSTYLITRTDSVVTAAISELLVKVKKISSDNIVIKS
jgi:DNA-binding transcriptional LysR family regulator